MDRDKTVLLDGKANLAYDSKIAFSCVFITRI